MIFAKESGPTSAVGRGYQTLVVLLILWCSAAGISADTPSPTPLPSGQLFSPTPAVTPTTGPMLPTPTPTLSPAIDRNALLREYTNAQKTAISALRHQNAMEIKMLDAAQSAAYKDYWAKEVQKRRSYFDTHTSGKDKRTYVQDMNARRKTFLQIQKDEHTRRLQEQKVRLESEQEVQTRNLKEFNEALKAGQVPPQRLWPQTH